MKTVAICACILLLPAFTFALNINDNGYVWRKSSVAEKKEVAEEIGVFFKKPATFFYDLFEYAYDTDKPERLNKSIVDLAFEQGKPIREQQSETQKETKKSVLTINDNGHAWCKSSIAEKKEVAEELGSFFKMPPTFFYNFFEYAYDTDKPERLNECIIDLALQQGKPLQEQPAEAYEKPKKGS